MNKKGLYCRISENLLNSLDQYCTITGKTKTFIIENALRKEMNYFLNNNDEIQIQKGIFYEGYREQKALNKTIDWSQITNKPCFILGQTQIYNQDYTTIYMDNQLMKVPSYLVKIEPK